jgi:hypothetical protein
MICRKKVRWDEMSKQHDTEAGYFAFFTAMVILFALSMLSGLGVFVMDSSKYVALSFLLWAVRDGWYLKLEYAHMGKDNAENEA